MALPFVPEYDIQVAWQAFSDELSTSYPLVAQTMVPYLESTWMYGSYPLDVWNCYSRTRQNIPRTNNRSEGSNNALRSHFGCTNTVIWTAITKLKEFQAGTDLDLTQFYTKSWRAPSKKLKDREARIRSMVATYNRTDALQYIRRLGYMFSHIIVSVKSLYEGRSEGGNGFT